jgi:outer membrane receptor protein involved in Fe transport
MLLAAVLLLQTQTASDTITVTATRTETRIADTPGSVVVLSAADLAATPAATIDDALRQVPGFTLFRRSGSRTANPTSQGVSLRGIGASGASRALVLEDGIPLNDPFGGWVYWGRVPRAAMERVEVLRGGASDLYGSGAMGGVIQFLRRRDAALVVETSAGSQETATASLFAAGSSGEWRGSVAADFLTTAGWVLVDERQRGAVDRAADARHTSVDTTLARGGFFLRASHYDESRNNGTPLQINDTTIRQLAAGMDAGPFVARLYGSDQDYRQTFSAITADRASERLTVDQRVPSRSAGGSGQVSHVIGTRHALVAGAEGRQVSGASDEPQFTAAGTRFVESAGRQRTASAFLEDLFLPADRVSITAGIRFDSWRNFDAHRNTTALADRSDSAWSPRLSVLFRAGDRLALTASAYRAFRAPTLNELYRGFRVGNVQTDANESLGPERLSAIELGLRSGAVRLNVFQMNVEDTIANVTLSTTPALITRQRRNLGTTRSRGAELEGDWRLGSLWRASGGYLFSDSVVTSGALDGKRIPQVARHQATLQLAFSPPKSQAGVQVRWSSRQFDDDLNELPLRGYVVADLFASRTISGRFSATLAVENLFDRRIEAGATPVITLGTPRAMRVGLRYGR